MQRNFPTCHCHPQSLDSASTPEAFAERELELGTGVITVTDHGTLVACRKVYDLAKKKNLTPVLGLEGYLRDDDCPILTASGKYPKNKHGAFIGAPKYMHVTMHFLDQEAYECGVRLLSAADARLEETLQKLEPEDRKHGKERKPLFTWRDLEELGSHNVTMTTGCLIGAVQRHILENNDLATAEGYYQRLKSCVKPGNFYVEVFPHDCSKNWVQGVFIDVLGDDGKTYQYNWYAEKNVLTDHPDKDKAVIKVEALAKAFESENNEHVKLVAVQDYRKWNDLPPGKIVGIKHIADFVPNECRFWAPDGDVQAGLNKIVIKLAKKYGDKILIGDDSHYAHADEKIVQDVRLAQSGGSWRFYGNYHRQSGDEAFDYFHNKLGTSEAQFGDWAENAYEWAARFKDFKFETQVSLPTKFYEEKYSAYSWHSSAKPADYSLRYTMELIKKHGRMDWSNKAYTDRLTAEIKLLHYNGTLDLLPYFFLDEEVCSLYESKGMLTGPGRGSAAGLLLTYLLGITHVDPLRFNLSMERFITVDRIKSGKLPDIDQDLPTRDPLVDPATGWLKERFGDHYAQISVDTTLKLKAAVKDVARTRSDDKRVPDDVEALTKKFEMPPQGVNDLDFVLGYDTDEGHVQGSVERDPALKEYIKLYPEAWKIVQKCLGLARQKGRHACAYVIANRPIHEFIPLTTVSDVRVTSYTAGSVEAVGGLKMDFLVINSLNDIGDAIRLIQKRSGLEIPEVTTIRGRRVPGHRLLPGKDGQLHDIWDLPEDQEVFADVACGRTETVFQFNTPGAVQWLEHFGHKKTDGTYAIDSIEAMAAFTALDRPGPLDITVSDPDDTTGQRRHNMLVEYARRARGDKPSPDVLQVFDELLPETFGVMVYQEQLQRVYQQLTGCSGPEAEEFRSDVAKKKKSKIDQAYKPFIEAASVKIGKENAEAAWAFFVTWAKYGFNKSHAVCYSVIGYACAYLKHYYPLEWWTAVLKNADKNEVNDKFWRYCGHIIDVPDVKYSGPNFEIQNERIRAPLSLLHGVGAVAHKQLCQYAPYTDIFDFCQKIQKHRIDTGKTIKKLKKVSEKIPNPDTTNPRKKTATVKVEKEVDHFQAGYNSLHGGVVRKLIISGAMDSLFPKTKTVLGQDGPQEVPTDVADYLNIYEDALAAATGGKRKAVDAKFLKVTPLQRFQMRKQVLPAYGENLIPTLYRTGAAGISRVKDRDYFTWKPPGSTTGREVVLGLADAGEFYTLNLRSFEENERIQIAVVTYVEGVRIFTYGAARNSACEFILDVEGDKYKVVKWGGKDGLPEKFKTDLQGSIAVAVLTKWRGDKPFVIDDVVVIEPPWKDKDEEPGTDSE